VYTVIAFVYSTDLEIRSHNYGQPVHLSWYCPADTIRGLFLEYNVTVPHNAKKADLVLLFETQVRGQAAVSFHPVFY
jgi:hypothetical protein